MLNDTLLTKLKQITEEEKRILEGQTIEKSLYTKKNEFEIESEKVLDQKLITVRTHTRFTDFPNHKHDYIEMMYVVEGTIHHIIDGKEVILNQGEILLMNKHSWHAIKKASENDIAINFIILPSFFDVVYDMIGHDSIIAHFLIDILRQDENSGEYLLFHVADILQIQNLMENMIQSLYEKESEYDKENQITMGLLFMYLTKYINRTTKVTSKRFEELLVETCLDYIAQNYKQATLVEIANELHLPDYTISKLLKQKTGSTFKELLQSRRFYRAEELLMDTDLPIEDIIYSVGYEGHSYFFRRFKEKNGITPKQYRNNRRK